MSYLGKISKIIDVRNILCNEEQSQAVELRNMLRNKINICNVLLVNISYDSFKLSTLESLKILRNRINREEKRGPKPTNCEWKFHITRASSSE